MSRLSRVRAIRAEIVHRGVYDVKPLSVATRQLRAMMSKADVDTEAKHQGAGRRWSL
jgi:hypothetical protein